jgi:signal transduction histidine kinase
MASQFRDGHADEVLWRLFRGLGNLTIDEIPLFAETIRSGRTAVVNKPDVRRLPPALRPLGLQEVLVVPLVRHGEVTGLMTFDNVGEQLRPIKPLQVEMATTIASQVTLVVENASLQEETRRSLVEAQAANRAKSEFLANVSHEIRTPLNGVLGMSEILLASDPPADLREPLAVIKASADALRGLIDNILDLSKIEAEQLTLDRLDFDLSDTLAQVFRLLLPAAHGKGIELRLDTAPAGARLCGDELRLRQILLNLVGNAIKFTGVGSVSVRVEQAQIPGRDLALRFTVQDTGIGIVPAARERLFEAFAQADASITRRYGGTGLGLAITHRLVELMGGEIGFETVPDEGSAFWAIVPFDRPQEGVSAMLPAAEKRAAQAQRARFCVLIADDNDVNRLVISRQLEILGYRFETVTDGGEAVNAFAARRFDAVLMDCRMPEMDGYEATRRLRLLKQGGDVPVIAVTAFSLQEEVDRCFAAGMNDYLAKPFRLNDLAAVLDRWLL